MMEKLKSFFISKLDKEIETNNEFLSWPPSNYPIFLALILFAATAATLAIGDEKRAGDLAIYAYYFLVIGVIIRFLEFVLPENALQRLSTTKKRTFGFIEQHTPGSMGANNNKIINTLRRRHAKLQPFLHRAKLEIKMHISDPIKQYPPVLDSLYIQKLGNMLKKLYVKLSHLHLAKPRENFALISEISRTIAIFLSVFFVISLFYGLTIDWWFVEKYFSDLVLIILGFMALHIFIRVRF